MNNDIRISKQISDVDATILHKTNKGISFAQKVGNTISYINIPNHPHQEFKFFYNPSSISNEERKRILEKRQMSKMLFNREAAAVTEIDDDV